MTASNANPAGLHVELTDLPGVLVVRPERFGDARGYLSETWNRRVFAAAGLDVDFVQDNESWSAKAGTVRGLHFQAPPHAQAKLVRCVRGRLWDVAVDLRRESPTYARWTAVELSAENGLALYVPEGFAHGFVTLEPDTVCLYKCSAYYAPEAEGALRWNDPDLGIAWPVAEGEAVLSERDAAAPLFRDFVSPFGGGEEWP